MLVALERFDLRIPACHSLKEKRHVVKALTSAIRSSFNVSVAEVDHQDLWQRSTIAVAATVCSPMKAASAGFVWRLKSDSGNATDKFVDARLFTFQDLTNVAPAR